MTDRPKEVPCIAGDWPDLIWADEHLDCYTVPFKGGKPYVRLDAVEAAVRATGYDVPPHSQDEFVAAIRERLDKERS